MSGTARRKGANEVTPSQAGAVLGLVFLAVYVLTRTRDVGGDDTVFAQTVEAWLRHGSLWWTFFHPHHLIYNPLAALVTACGRVIAPSLLAVDAGAYLSAACAAAAVGLLTALLMRRGLSTAVSILAATAMGLSGGFWQFATRMEVYTLAALAVLAWLWVMSRDEPTPGPSGLALGGGLLAHLAMVVLAPATYLRTAPPLRRRLAALALGLGAPAFALALLFTIQYGFHPSGWLQNVMPAGSGQYLGVDIGGPLRALTGLLWWGWYRVTPVLTPAAAHAMEGLATLSSLLVAALVLLASARLRLRGPDTRLVVTALLALCGFLPLWLAWDPGNVEHAVASAPLWAVLVAAGAQGLPRRLGPMILGLLAFCLAAGNGLGSAIPQSRPENGRIWVLASFVRETVPADGTVLSAGSDPRLRLGLPYLSGRHVVDLTLAAASARRQGRDPALALRYWLHGARKAGTVWLLPDVLDPGSQRWVEELGIPAEEWRRALSAFRVVKIRSLPPDGVVLEHPFELALAEVRGGGEVSP